MAALHHLLNGFGRAGGEKERGKSRPAARVKTPLPAIMEEQKSSRDADGEKRRISYSQQEGEIC